MSNYPILQLSAAMSNRKIMQAPSGEMVEIKDQREGVAIVYRLDENNERIKEINAMGEQSFKIGIITRSQLPK